MFFYRSVIKSLFPLENHKPPVENIKYGNLPRQVMGISVPSTADEDNKVRIALFIHGGNWMGGYKSDFGWLKETTNNRNFTYVTMNYRLLHDNVTYIEMLDDVHSAIKYLKDNSNLYYLDTDKMFVMGNSAGGHLALLYPYSKESPVEIG